MEKNVGGLDQIVRIVLGPILLVIALGALLGLVTLEPLFALVALGVGVVLTVTGVTQKCPANNAIGLNTYRPRAEAEQQDFTSGNAR